MCTTVLTPPLPPPFPPPLPLTVITGWNRVRVTLGGGEALYYPGPGNPSYYDWNDRRAWQLAWALATLPSGTCWGHLLPPLLLPPAALVLAALRLLPWGLLAPRSRPWETVGCG